MPAFRKLGIDKVVVVTTNDQYVNAAWTAQFDTGSKDKITFVSDGDGELVRALGLAEDMGYVVREEKVPGLHCPV
jgi:peroxiredoxin